VWENCRGFLITWWYSMWHYNSTHKKTIKSLLIQKATYEKEQKKGTLKNNKNVISWSTSTTQVLTDRNCTLNRNDRRLLRRWVTLCASMPDGQGGALNHINTTTTFCDTKLTALNTHLYCRIHKCGAMFDINVSLELWPLLPYFYWTAYRYCRGASIVLLSGVCWRR